MATPTAHSSYSASEQIIATLISQRGVLTASDWDLITTALALGLREELQSSEQPTLTTRPLDTSHSSSTDDPRDAQHRVLEATISFQPNQPRTPHTLAQCSALTHTPSLVTIRTTHSLDIILQPSSLHALHRSPAPSPSHGAPGLIIFDMDSTLIQQEVIDELARCTGKYDQVSAITDAAMRGEAPYTDFSASLATRVALLKGVSGSIWTTLRESGVITFTPGGKELVAFLRGRGWKTGVLSGGFTPLAEWVKAELGLDYAYANHLAVDEGDGSLTGELVEGKPIVHAERKRELLGEIAEKESIEMDRTVAVGDGSNDLLMMGRAGLGVAFRAKPKVQELAPCKINSESLLDIAYVLGFTDQEVSEGTKRSEHRV